MEGNSKKELIPCILAIIGLIADILGIYGAIKGNVSNGSLSNNASFLTVFIVIIIYAWITIAWFYILRAIKKNPSDIVIERTSIQIGIPIGIGLFPLYIVTLISLADDALVVIFLIWLYLLLLCFLPIGICVFMKANYSVTHNEVTWSYFSNTMIVLFLVFVFGMYVVAGSFDPHPREDGQYVCSFPFNEKQTHIKIGEMVVADYDNLPHRVIITDSLGNKDTVDWEVFEVHFRKK